MPINPRFIQQAFQTICSNISDTAFIYISGQAISLNRNQPINAMGIINPANERVKISIGTLTVQHTALRFIYS